MNEYDAWLQLERLCRACGKLVDNYGRCCNHQCGLQLLRQHPNLTRHSPHGRIEYGKKLST